MACLRQLPVAEVPFCGIPFCGKLPVLNLYSAAQPGNYRPDNHRLMVYCGQWFFPWHVNRLVTPNERLTEEQKARVGYFVFHNKAWYLVNENMPQLIDKSSPGRDVPIPIGGKIELADGQKLLLSPEPGGRLIVVQMVDA